MNKITATIITFNEENNIRECLDSISWADEIVIVDSFSTDKTVEICKRYTDRIIEREWPGYIEQKNFAIDQSSYDWIFAIDADEVVSPELKDEILLLKNMGFDKHGYKMPRKVFYLNRWILHGTWYPDYKIRLFNRRYGRWGGINPHDTVILDGICGTLKHDLYHYTYEDLLGHINQINKFSSISAAELKKRGKKPSIFNIIVNPFVKFMNSYFIRRGFMDGKVGFFIACIISFETFLKYIKLWELYYISQSE
jgi:glycosyltransferase involved in cell wall biosynthesis